MGSHQWVRWMRNIRYYWLEYWNVMWIWNRYIVVRELESYIDGKYKRLWLGHWKLWWALHDTEIYVPSRDDNCRLANRQLFVLRILFKLIGSGIIGRLIERSDLRLFGIEESNRSRSVMEAELGFPLWRLPEREIVPSLWRGTQCQII